MLIAKNNETVSELCVVDVAETKHQLTCRRCRNWRRIDTVRPQKLLRCVNGMQLLTRKEMKRLHAAHDLGFKPTLKQSLILPFLLSEKTLVHHQSIKDGGGSHNKT